MAVSCSADRQALGKITADGLFLEQLETDPAHFLPAVEASDLLDAEPVHIDLNRPMDEIRATLSELPVTTQVMLTGPMIVARDIAHAKIKERLDAGEEMPQYWKDHAVYYAGPAKTPDGYASGSFGPTTAGRMDSYVPEFQAAGGSMVMLAKGNRSQQVTDSCAANGGFYLGSIGGPAARLALDNIKQVDVLEYPELGMEAIWKIEVENFPAFVVVDDKGNDFYAQVRAQASMPVSFSTSLTRVGERGLGDVGGHAEHDVADHLVALGVDRLRPGTPPPARRARLDSSRFGDSMSPCPNSSSPSVSSSSTPRRNVHRVPFGGSGCRRNWASTASSMHGVQPGNAVWPTPSQMMWVASPSASANSGAWYPGVSGSNSRADHEDGAFELDRRHGRQRLRALGHVVAERRTGHPRSEVGAVDHEVGLGEVALSPAVVAGSVRRARPPVLPPRARRAPRHRPGRRRPVPWPAAPSRRRRSSPRRSPRRSGHRRRRRADRRNPGSAARGPGS